MFLDSQRILPIALKSDHAQKLPCLIKNMSYCSTISTPSSLFVQPIFCTVSLCFPQPVSLHFFHFISRHFLLFVTRLVSGLISLIDSQTNVYIQKFNIKSGESKVVLLFTLEYKGFYRRIRMHYSESLIIH